MTKKRYIKSYTRPIGLLGIALVFCFFSKAQKQIDDGNNPIQLAFFKDSVLLKPDDFSFNSIRLTNTGSIGVSFQLQLLNPDYTTLVSAPLQNISLQAGETTIIPIRFNLTASKFAPANWNPFGVRIISNKQATIQAAFFVKAPTLDKWKANLIIPQIIINSETRNLSFTYLIENLGNTRMTYTPSYKSHLPLDENSQKAFVLEPSENKLIQINILLPFTALQNILQEEVDILIKNDKGETKQLYQKIIRIGAVFTENRDTWQKMPLSIEWNANNFFSQQAMQFVRLSGNMPISKTQTIGLQIQSNNYYRGFATNTGTYNLQYASTKWHITAGTFMDFNQYQIFGDGIQAKFSPNKKSSYEAAYYTSRLNNGNQFNLKTNHQFNSNLTLTNNSFANIDPNNQSSSIFHQTGINLKFLKEYHLSLTVGVGKENLRLGNKDTLVWGNSQDIRIDKLNGRLFLSTILHRYTGNFPGLNKGLLQYQQDIRIKFGKFGIGGFVDYMEHSPIINNGREFIQLFNYSSADLSAKLSYNASRLAVNIMPGYFIQKQDSLNSFTSTMPKITTQIHASFGKNWLFYLNSIIGVTTFPPLPESSIRRSLSTVNMLTLQNNFFGIQLRYDYGPYFYFEIKQYRDWGIQNKRIELSPFIGYNFQKINLSFRSQLNYSNSIPETYNFTNLLNNISWNWQKHALSVGMNSIVSLRKDRGQNMFNFFVRKTLYVPVFAKKGLQNTSVILFKDLDHNGVYNSGDETISQLPVFVNEMLLETDNKGEIFLRNFSSAAVRIDFATANSLRGWIPANGHKQEFAVLNKQKIYIPFVQSKTISGKLIVDKALFTDNNIELGGIRISAAGLKGNTYFTLTNSLGEYILNLPEDEYILSLNIAAIEEKFIALDAVKNISLKDKEKDTINFIIKERKQRMNLKKG